MFGRVAAAVMLGVGAIFQAKPEEHWSTSPKVTLETERESEAGGDPPPDGSGSGLGAGGRGDDVGDGDRPVRRDHGAP
jgi:hypothetical protein